MKVETRGLPPARDVQGKRVLSFEGDPMLRSAAGRRELHGVKEPLIFVLKVDKAWACCYRSAARRKTDVETGKAGRQGKTAAVPPRETLIHTPGQSNRAGEQWLVSAGRRRTKRTEPWG